MDDDEFVETSDIEELAEQGGKESLFFPSTPPRAIRPAHSEQHYSPRKRIKLFHAPIDTEEDGMGLPIPFTGGSLNMPASPTRTSSSTTMLTSSSPTPGAMDPTSSRSRTRTPSSPQQESLPKLEEEIDDDFYGSPYSPPLEGFSQEDPLLLLSQPQKTDITTHEEEITLSSIGSPLLESQVDPSYEDHIPTEDITIAPSSTTPPDTPHSAYQSSRSPRSLSPDILALGSPSPQWHTLDDANSLPDDNNDTSTGPPTKGSVAASASAAEIEAVDDELLLFSPVKPGALLPVASASSPRHGEEDDQPANAPESQPLFTSPGGSHRRSLSPAGSSPVRVRFGHSPTPSPPPAGSSPVRVRFGHSPTPTPSPPAASPRHPALPAHPPQPPSAGPALEEEEESVHVGRYSFRKRNAAQKKPYTVDNIVYQHALKANPDAIVKNRQLERHRHHRPDDHYDDDDDAGLDGMDLDVRDEEEWAERERRMQRKAEKEREKEQRREGMDERDMSHYPAILQDDLSTDDDGKEMDADVKQARKALRALEKAKKAREKEERRRRKEEEEDEKRRRREEKGKGREGPHRLKPYPLSKPDSTRRASTSRSVGPSSSRNPTIEPEPQRVLPDEDDVLQKYFDQDDFEMFGPDDMAAREHDDLNQPGPSNWGSPARSPVPSADLPLQIQNPENNVLEIPSDEEGQTDAATLAELAFTRKQKRTLGRLMPTSMLPDLLVDKAVVQRRKAQREKELERRSDTPGLEEGPLVPGQTRVRMAAGLNDAKDVRGDSESEEEQPSDSDDDLPPEPTSESDSDSVEILQTYRPPPSSRPKEEDNTLVNADFDEDDGDEDIQFFLQHMRTDRYRPESVTREPNLIDYMLPRVHTTGGGPRRRRKRRSEGGGGSRRDRRSSSSRYKLDIMTRDARGIGRDRQTLLSFDKHEKKHRKHDSGRDPIVPRSNSGGGGGNSSRPPMGRSASRSTNDTLFDAYAQQPLHKGKGEQQDVQVHTVVAQDPKHLSYKERKKQRNARKKLNGVHHFKSGNGNRIETGRSRRADAAYFTVDVEDYDLNRALAPMSSGLFPAARYEPPPRHSKKAKQPSDRAKSSSTLFEPPEIVAAYDQNTARVPAQGPQAKKTSKLVCDLNIKPLISGKTFGQSTYTRKGWLQELIDITSGLQDPITLPSTATLCKYELDPAMGVVKLCAVLPKLLDDLFEDAVDILNPDSDSQADEWKPGLRAATQLVSWYFKTTEADEKKTLCETIEKEVVRIATRIDEHNVNFFERPILSLSWFLVELAARASVPLPTSYAALRTPLKATSTLLLRFLLRFGINKVANLLQTDANLDEASPANYAAELWVCIIHLLLPRPKDGHPPTSKSHPFWLVFMDALHSVPPGPDQDTGSIFKASEDIWITIFTVCAISQFSAHGMTTGKSRLPAYWDLVAFALKKICLTENGSEHQHLQAEILRRRDGYVALVVTRCAHMQKAWDWCLDDVSNMFNKLAEIFRSRNFANLRHEDERIPEFFKRMDWDLLSVHDTTDTSFSLFLKFIYQAAQEEKAAGRKSTAAKTKKLLSFALPVVPFKISQPPLPRNMTMFHNRLSAVALALLLDSSDHAGLLKKAREFIAFPEVDGKTRNLVLMYLKRLAILMVKRNMDLDPMLGWIEDIVKTLEPELKELSSKTPPPAEDDFRRAPLVQLVNNLFVSISEIVHFYAAESRFPNPHILRKLKPILTLQIFKSRTDTFKEAFSLLLDAIFTARMKALPKPPRPLTPDVEQEESQDYFDAFGDIDFDAIDDGSEGVPVSDILEKDKQFRQDMDGKLKWTIYAYLKAYMTPPPPTVSQKAYANECDKWLRIWLCFGSAFQEDDNKWHKVIQPIKEGLKASNGKADNDPEDPWAYRVTLSRMFQLLQLAPMEYLTYRDDALEVFFRALVSDTVSLENEYVSLVLSIDCLKHPLFAGLTFLPARDPVTGDYRFSAEQFLEIRLSLIRAIMANINSSLGVQGGDHIHANETYIDYCHKMFSWMRRVRSLLLQKVGEEGEKVKAYSQFCLQVLQAFQENYLLKTHSRLEFFAGWARTLKV